MRKVQSTCNYCALDCNLDFYVEDNQIVKVVPTKGYPVNDGFSCVKGLSLDKQQSVIKTPHLPRIRQKDGTYAYSSWDECNKLVAKRLLEIKETYGSESIAGISTGQLTMEEFAIFGHIMRNHLKANVDGNTRLCMATSVVAHKQCFGFDAPGFTLQDLEVSDTIIFIGANPIVAHPILWDRVQKNNVKNRKIIVIDPRKSETAKNADYWYGIKAKSDLLLLYAIAHQLIEKDYIDKAFIAAHTNKFAEFKEFLKEYPIQRACDASGLTKAQIDELVEIIHQGKRVSFWWTMGINQGHEAVRSAQAIINLALMTGNIGKPGTGANSITGQCNAMGSRLFSNTACLYGGGDFTNPTRRKAVATALHVDEEALIDKPTLTYNQIVEKINAGEIKALWVLCTNPAHSWIHNQTFHSAIQKLELFIVQDIYDNTDTSMQCDIFLPAVPGIKKEGTYINMERRLSAMRPCLTKAEDERCDYEIIYGIGEALGLEDVKAYWKTPADAFNMMQQCSKGMPCDFTGTSWEALENSKGVQWPLQKGEELKDHQRRLYEDGNFFTTDQKAVFVFEAPLENPLPQTAEFPYIFNTGRGSVGQWHTQTRTREVVFIEDVSSKKAYVYLHPHLAKQKGIMEGDVVVISSCNGASADFFAKISDDVKEDELFAPLHYIECNNITPSVYDKYSKEPSYKAGTVNLMKKEGLKYDTH